jgi:amino acid adenylation domain-containing protein
MMDSGQRLSTLPRLTEEERYQLLIDWNNTKTDYSQSKCIHHLFEDQVKRTPGAIAVVFEDKQLTYQELDQRANRLARHLQMLGIAPEAPVGIFIERSLEMVVGLLAILKAGGAYVPLDPTYPQERLTFMLEDSQVLVLLTHSRLVDDLLPPQLSTICLDTWQPEADIARIVSPCATVPENVAYIIYTSGSTGKPKGVQILHRAVVNFLEAMRQEPGLTAQDVLLSVTTLSFDISVLELFLPLSVGARLVLASQETAADPAKLMSQLTSAKATVMQATPTTWQMLLALGWPGDQNLKILCGGEALSRELAHQLLSRSASLWNMYGPTETTIWSLMYQVTAVEGPIPIGRPIANTEVYIVDDYLQPVPVGVPGRLLIGGEGLARGYLNRPDLTVERFIPHPFSQKPEARLYDTGDMARYRSDGTVEYLGRADFQVKVRGFRIELGEIETALESHPQIQRAVVIVREDIPDDRRIVAYYMPASGQEVASSNDLRRYLQQTLPDYMIPSVFVLVNTMPLTPNGKINRHALPVPDRSRFNLEETFVAPHTLFEKEVINIWAELLDFEQIGLYDNFFELGGHSLLTVQLIFRISETFKVDLSLHDVLTDGRTVAGLVRLIENTLLDQIEAQEFEDLLAELDGLSDDEVKALLDAA